MVDTWWLADRGVSLYRAVKARYIEVRRATRDFQRALQAEQRRRVNNVVEEVEALMKEGQTREAWGSISRWYLNAKRHNPPPSREGLNHIYAEREELYRCRSPEVQHVPVMVRPGEVDNCVPDETYMLVVV